LASRYIRELPPTPLLPRAIDIPEDKNILLTGVTQSGKSSLILYHLQQTNQEFLYIDFDERDIDEVEFQELILKSPKDGVKTLVLDIYNFKIERYIDFIQENFPSSRIVVISWRGDLEIDNFHHIYLQPLSFEEFISFKSGVETIEHTFVRYSQIGGFPIFPKQSDLFTFRQLKRLFYFALSNFEIDILKDIAKSIGTPRSRLNIFSSLKERRKISKDKFYSSIKKLILEGYVIEVDELNSTITKKHYLIDSALQNSFELRRDFYKLFENMVVSELYKKGEDGKFYKSIDILIEDKSLAILILPFIEMVSLKRKVGRIYKIIQKLDVKRVEVVTMNFETNFIFKDVEIEAIKFIRWACSR